VKKGNQEQIQEYERDRLDSLLAMELQIRSLGYRFVAGIDEAGRGPLAGPVVAAACIMPEGLLIAGIDDSKKLTAAVRNTIYRQLTDDPRISFGVGIVLPSDIDRLNIFQATVQAMMQAVANLQQTPDYLLVDGLKLAHPSLPAQKVIGGDRRCYSIAAASIIAKETRDRLMLEIHETWPAYGFDKHKGYGTPYHLEALQKHGPTPIHRRSFEPVKSMVSQQLTFF